MSKKSQIGYAGYTHPAIAVSSKTILLCCFAALYWLVFMLVLMRWYKAEFHVLATFGSVMMMILGNGWGYAKKWIG